MPWPTEAQCPIFYGTPWIPGTAEPNGKWIKANIVDLVPPYQMEYSWGPRVTALRFHRKCRDAFGEALLEIKKLYGTQKEIEAHRMHLTGGSLVIRLMRGSHTKWSIHSYGAALDIDPQHNPYPHKWNPAIGIPREVVDIFQKCSLIWRGADGDVDPMHIQAARRK